jgi:ABC-type branched-subunit amino acid transport system permease subunit
MSDYRLLVLKLTMIAIMLTLSINVINGYMGEFSCSHPGFMALGAYAASTVTLLLFANDKLLSARLLFLPPCPHCRRHCRCPGRPGHCHPILPYPWGLSCHNIACLSFHR